jgi:hypothetical protein
LLTLPREILEAPEFQDPEVVLVERHNFIEVWSMGAWDLTADP